MLWELSFSNAVTKTVQHEVAEFTVYENFNGLYNSKLEYKNLSHIFRVEGCQTREEAKNQLAQEVADKLAELSAVATALKDFQIEGS
jgi:predicted SprT family Zn-dependent metalloprotease